MIIANGKVVTWGDPNEILEDKDYVVIFDVENGEVKSINLGCYN